MERKFAFVISFLITGLIVVNYLFFVGFDSFDREIVVVEKVIDGDTVELEDGRTIRLLNVNTEEKGRPWADEATEFLKKFEGESVELEVTGVGSYGRQLGKFFYESNYLNLELVRLGFAHGYLVDGSEVKDFKNAERRARDLELGIWERSENYGCLDVEIDKYEEFVVVEDNCELDFGGWSLKDESTQMYKFKNDVDAEFIVYSREGTDKNNELYWGRGKAWNDEGDSIFIRDAFGYLVYYSSY